MALALTQVPLAPLGRARERARLRRPVIRPHYSAALPLTTCDPALHVLPLLLLVRVLPLTTCRRGRQVAVRLGGVPGPDCGAVFVQESGLDQKTTVCGYHGEGSK